MCTKLNNVDKVLLEEFINTRVDSVEGIDEETKEYLESLGINLEDLEEDSKEES